MTRPRPPAGLIRQTILDHIAARADGRPVSPADVARSLAGSDEKAWRLLMPPIRTEAVRLARAGQIVIVRKGRKADPRDFKGLYSLAAPDFVGKPEAAPADDLADPFGDDDAD